jgi:DNA (cytosine-5)-methyltransferase 1
MSPKFIIVDLFCGAGGTTLGYEMTNGLARVIACVNHDPKAIRSHWRNHSGVRHFNEDIRTLDLTKLMKVVKWWRRKYPEAKLVLWASLECTNFSKAKGGLPRDADSRTLAEHLHRYIVAMNPDMIQIENVVEFMSWGPLDANGKPESKKSGKDWLRWRREVCAHGYVDEWRELNSADFGAYTSRNRLFGMFARDNSYIAWPEPTHTKTPGKGLLFAQQKKWKPVREVLDLQDEGRSIFDRKKPLSDKTLHRIYAGMIKYVAGGKDMFIAKYYSGRPNGKVIPVDGPAGTITTADGQSIVRPVFILKYNSMNKNGHHLPPSLEEPCPTIAVQNRLGTVFLTKYYSQGGQLGSIDEPAATIPCGDRFAKVQAQWLDKQYTGNRNHQSIDQPAGVVTPNPKLSQVSAERFHYIVNPSWNGNGSSVDQPSPVIIARQDKAPLYLVAMESGPVAIAVYDTDSEIMIKIKEFMVLYEIVDIKMRMLKVLELLKIQGFPEDYILEGNQTDQKKFIGNSVVPLVVKCWIEAIDNSLKIAA